MGSILNKIRSVCHEQSKGKYSQEEAYRKIKEILYKHNKIYSCIIYDESGKLNRKIWKKLRKINNVTTKK